MENKYVSTIMLVGIICTVGWFLNSSATETPLEPESLEETVSQQHDKRSFLQQSGTGSASGADVSGQQHDKRSFPWQSSSEPTPPEVMISGVITRILDGSTIYVDGTKHFFAVTGAPNVGDLDGIAAKQRLMQMCQIGSTALVEVTDRGSTFGKKYVVGIVYCDTDDYQESVGSRLAREGHMDSLYVGNCDSLEAASYEWAVENDEYFYYKACGGHTDK